MSNDFDQIVESYMPAAAILMMTRGEVESAVFCAMRMERRCESCRYSRAPHGVEQIARGVGILPIYHRRCLKQPPCTRCPDWQRLEIPQKFLERELEVSR